MIRVIKTTLGLLSSKERYRYFTLVSIRALSGLLDVLGIAGVGLIAAIAVAPTSSQSITIFGVEISTSDKSVLLKVALFVLTFFVLKAIIAVLMARSLGHFVSHIESKFGKSVFSAFVDQPVEEFSASSKGEILWAAIASSEAAAQILMSAASIVSEFVLLILVGITLFAFDPVAAISVMLYLGAVVIILQLGLGRAQRKAALEASSAYVSSATALEDYSSTFREITVYGAAPFFKQKFAKSRERLAITGADFYFLGTIPRYVIETALMLGVLLFVGWQFLSGQLENSVAVVGVFLTGGVRVMASFLPLQSGFASIKRYAEQALPAQRVLSGLGSGAYDAPTSVDLPTPKFARRKSDVVLTNVNKSFTGSGHKALDNINLVIRQGEKCAVIGKSGAGKSTLIEVILGLTQPDSGDVTIAGVSSSIYRDFGSQSVAYLPQKPGLITGSLAENIALGVDRREIDKNRLAKVVDQAGLSEFVLKLDRGVDTEFDGQLESLSGGQLQRIGLARALYQRPKLLILDEATSALDAKTENQIAQTLEALAKSTTVITVAHRLSTIQHADRVLVMDKGRIIAEGTLPQLIETNEVVREFAKLIELKRK